MSFPKKLFLVIFISACVTAALIVSLWDMNLWPTDTEKIYMPAALQLPFLEHLSDIHRTLDKERIKWLHGKEMLIVLTSLTQRWMGDFSTLRPFIVVCAISLGLSMIFVFLVAARYWGSSVGLICYFLFTTSLWPYVYVLFTKHQPLGLFYFLLAIVSLQVLSSGRLYKPMILCSGMFLGFSLFSSPVAGLYVPCWLAALAMARNKFSEFFFALTLAAAGALFIAVFINYPDTLDNLKHYLAYIHISESQNHFFYNQPSLREWLNYDSSHLPRSGWLWVIKYSFLIMPVLFPVYLICLVWLLMEVWRKPSTLWQKVAILGMILLSLSSPILAEIKHIAQYGGTYFPFFLGVIILIGYALSLAQGQGLLKKRWIIFIGVFFLIAHAGVNLYIFLSDVYPSRMATTFLSRKLEELKIDKLYAHQNHPLAPNFISCLNPKTFKHITPMPIETIAQPIEGKYLLILPTTGDSLYQAMRSHYTDLDKDLYLNALIRQGRLADYAVASFETMASSRIWPQEEEILSYRYLILNQFAQRDPQKEMVWILDHDKFIKDIRLFDPSPEEIELLNRGVRNIGTRQRIFLYQRHAFHVSTPGVLNVFPARMYKVGNPQDELIAYLYKDDEKDLAAWVPWGNPFFSNPVSAQDLSCDPGGKVVDFGFPRPIHLDEGLYLIVIYRSGTADDKNFYRIYAKP